MKCKIAIIGAQGTFTKEELIAILKANCSPSTIFQIGLNSEFEIRMAQIILEVIKSGASYGLEVILHKSYDAQSASCKKIINLADNHILISQHNFSFVVNNCSTIICFNKLNHPLTYLASSLKRPVWFFCSYRQDEANL